MLIMVKSTDRQTDRQTDRPRQLAYPLSVQSIESATILSTCTLHGSIVQLQLKN